MQNKNSARQAFHRFPVRLTLAAMSAAVLLAGCAELDKALRKASQAQAIVNSRTAQTLIKASESADPEKVLKASLESRAEQYKDNPMLLAQDVETLRRDFRRLMNFLEVKASREWGSKPRLPSRKEYVKYTNNYRSRAIVDFDRGLVTVETVDQSSPREALRNAIITTLLTPDDPRAVDLFSDASIELNGRKAPYLSGLVTDQRGRAVDTPDRAEAFADHLLATRLKTRTVKSNGKSRKAHYIAIEMVSNFASKQAEKYRPLVEKYARKYEVSPSLVYAVIRTESNFNPFAVSHVPAYGLMQLVPTSGGRDAYRHAKGVDRIPDKDYLFVSENNIELGVAYLNLLENSYLAGIGNPVSREYCTISAYNTGAGNVLKTFSKNRTEALSAINRLEPPAVYDKLIRNLPYEETRHYLRKVVGFRKQFVSL